MRLPTPPDPARHRPRPLRPLLALGLLSGLVLGGAVLSAAPTQSVSAPSATGQAQSPTIQAPTIRAPTIQSAPLPSGPLVPAALLAAPDLLVYGATPQGITAAVTAARQGVRVLLVEPSAGIGGVLTRSWLATLDMSKDGLDGNGDPLARGLFLDFYRQLDHDNSFDVHQAEAALGSLLGGSGVTLLTRTQAEAVQVSGAPGSLQVRAVTLRGPHGAWTARPKRVIDASDNASLAAAAGAPFTLGRADTGLDDAQMAAGLVFKVSGLDWPALGDELRSALTASQTGSSQTGGSQAGRTQPGLQAGSPQPSFPLASSAVTGNPAPGSSLFSNSAISSPIISNPVAGTMLLGRSLVGLADVTAGYQPSDPSRFRLRGLNAARQRDGSLLVNALLIYGVDGTSPASLRRAHQEGEREAGRVVAYLRRALPQVFGQAQLSGVAPQVYVRESRHLVGDARLRASDVLYGVRVPGSVAVNGYPLDGQNYLPGQAPYLLGSPHPYEVGFGTLVPQTFTNLLVVSQAASFDSAAAFSARVVPLQMALGEAAGQASVLGERLDLSYRAISRSPLWSRVLSRWLSLRGARVSAPAPADGQTCRDRLDPRFAQASSLLDRALITSPYYFRGCLHLEGPELISDFVDDLQHALVTGGSAAGSTGGGMAAEARTDARRRDLSATLADLHLTYGESQNMLDIGTAHLILSALGVSSDQAATLLPDLPSGVTLRRTQAVHLLWTLEQRF